MSKRGDEEGRGASARGCGSAMHGNSTAIGPKAETEVERVARVYRPNGVPVMSAEQDVAVFGMLPCNARESRFLGEQHSESTRWGSDSSMRRGYPLHIRSNSSSACQPELQKPLPLSEQPRSLRTPATGKRPIFDFQLNRSQAITRTALSCCSLPGVRI